MTEILAIAAAFLLGLGARQAGLPPMVGYLIAGFLLFALGIRSTPGLDLFAQLGITLLLFIIGLKLRLRNLLMPQVWAVASLHMVAIVLFTSIGFYALGLAGLMFFSQLEFTSILLAAFALSFSSTVFAVKVLEDSGDMSALYSRIAIGVLIVQDIIAVVFLALSVGKIPTPWALLLLGLIPLRPLLTLAMEKAGHGELLVLFGLSLALGGATIFEMVGIKGDLGALILGLLLATHPKSEELARHLLSFKDLFLVGFFLTIGLAGGLTTQTVGIALLLALLLPLKTGLFFWLFSRFRLRARTAFLGSLSLANYSEFGLIVAAIAVSSGWLGGDWLAIIAIALAVSFIIAAPLNMASNRLYSRYRAKLLRTETQARIPEEADIKPGDTSVMILGMGRVGSGAYECMHSRLGNVVLGIDQDDQTAQDHLAAGRRVIAGSATDPEFWERMELDKNMLKLILLAMPSHHENLAAVQQIRKLDYPGRIAAIAKYDDEVERLKQAGVDYAVNLYAEAGSGFADDVWQETAALFNDVPDTGSVKAS
ncbi:MAG: cation:proton antiporter [Gammaproteobacteria bacterium]|nr:cation:proton antiporter [Gammaproteobacteria bacterium]MCF6260443.1 cation:proton antiporter [Gammaproteobacteria bacterium]